MSHQEPARSKSTVEEIRRRFDGDVERFSNLETGQSATVDAPLVLDLVTRAAAATTPGARRALDVGCGAGNYSLKLLQLLPDLDIELVDLSRPMLDRARERLRPLARGEVVAHQADIRDLPLEPGRYDLIVAAATLHHLREGSEWEAVFAKLHASLRPGGSMWVSDMIEHSIPAVQALMWERYGEYLSTLKDGAYRDQVFAYIEKEDTPRPLMYQLDLMRAVGFTSVDVLHKNGSFAAYGGVR
jgi:tRNA (cmo5U34)-methyltransferase